MENTVNNSKLNEVFKIISFFDDCRWHSSENYNLINYFDKTKRNDKTNLDADSILLTHWLCYITDRQMPFERIWDIGGFVFSELVAKLKETKNIELLNPDANDSFIKKEKDGKHYFAGTKLPNSRIIENYPQQANCTTVEFRSRFLPSDYLAILYTLHTLQAFGFSLSKYIAVVYNIFKNDKEHLVQRILFSLYLLTYQNIGQPDDKYIDKWDKNLKAAEKRTQKILKYINQFKTGEDEFKEFQKNTRYHSKRAWCSLRDFLKAPEFKPHFKEAMQQQGINVDELFEIQMLRQLELPGDVWNNNSKFGKCILSNTDYGSEKYKNKKLNEILREYFDNRKIIQGYPEQFDVSFSFVPRMCDEDNCSICPVNHFIVKKEKSSFEKICIDDTTKYCPVALACCDYKVECVGKKECVLWQDTAELNAFQSNKNDNTIFDDEKESSEKWEFEQLAGGLVWTGYCPESWLKGKQVRMRLNRNDFYESETTGLQIAVFRGAQAIIMNFRGKGNFRTSSIDYADEIANSELLCPQNADRFPFNNPTEIFESSQEIEDYIKNNVK
jgi:hypothetical protein